MFYRRKTAIYKLLRFWCIEVINTSHWTALWEDYCFMRTLVHLTLVCVDHAVVIGLFTCPSLSVAIFGLFLKVKAFEKYDINIFCFN